MSAVSEAARAVHADRQADRLSGCQAVRMYALVTGYIITYMTRSCTVSMHVFVGHLNNEPDQ